MIIGVDFDLTIAVSRYPEIIKPKFMAIPILKWLMRRHTCVLWTCRTERPLNMAIKWLKRHGIEFKHVNCNTPERIKQYGGDCRKLSCDLLIDDMAGFIFWPMVAIKVLVKEWNNEYHDR